MLERLNMSMAMFSLNFLCNTVHRELLYLLTVHNWVTCFLFSDNSRRLTF